MSTRPSIIAVDDDLQSIESAVAGDPADAIRDARTSLERFEVREAASQASLLDDVDASLLRAQEQVTGDAARRLEGIRNRLRIYRDSVSQTGEDLAVIDATVRVTEDGDEVGDRNRHEETGTTVEEEARAEIAQLHGESVEFVVTVVNGGTDRRVVIVVELYDEAGEEVRDVATDELVFEADEQVSVTLELEVPEDTAYVSATALDAETQTVR